MNDQVGPPLTKRSQALALEEFQIIDLNLDFIKNSEGDESPEQTKSSEKLDSKVLARKTSSRNLKRVDSKHKSSKPALLERRRSKSLEILEDSSATNLVKYKGNSPINQNYAGIRRSSLLESIAVRSLEETLMKVTELDKLDNTTKIPDEKPETVPCIVKQEQSPTSSFQSVDRRDVCRNKTCLDSGVHLPPINRTESQNLAWDIRGLGVPQANEEKMTSIVNKVNLRRKGKHDQIINEMDLRMNDLNDVIEQEIRQQAANVVSNIQMIKESVEQIMATIKEKACVCLNKKLVIRMQEIIKQLNDSRLSKIDSFCNFARNLERHRSDRFKLILKNAYKEMHDTMYLMPYEIQRFFEKKVQHLNEITINNYHCYTELQGKLKLQMEEEMRLWFQVIKSQETVNISVEEEKKNEERHQEPIQEVSEATVKGPTKADILKKLEKAEEDFLRLESVASNLNYLKSHPTLEIFENYLEEMRNAATALFHAGLIGKQGLCLDQQIIQDLSTLHCMDEEELRKIWSDGVREMLEGLDNNLKSFSNSTRIFNFYFERLEEMRTLYRQQLFLLLTKNERQTVQMNNAMNLLIDTLRQDVNEESLNKTLQQIEATILNIDTLIQNHLKEETALVDKFLQIALWNVDILLEELDRFIKQFVPPPDSDPRVMKKRASWMSVDELKNNDHLFSKDFLTCRFLMQGVDNWQFGVWHALITTMDTSKQTIAGILEAWASNEKQKFTRRSELKMKINNVRLHNIKEDFWKVRLAEVKIHEERFLRHELALRENIDKLAGLKTEMEETCRNFIDIEYSNRISEIMSGYASIRKERHAAGMINKLRGLNMSASLQMTEIHGKFKNEYLKILTSIRNSHIKFMKSIRLFSEGGNFTADEAKAIMKKITALEKLMSKEFTNYQKKIDDILEDFLEACQTKLEIPISSLNKALEEFIFKDEMERKVKRLHREIGEGVLDLTYDIRKLNGKIKSCREAAYSKDNLGNYDFLFSFSRCFKEILAEINNITQKLKYDDSLAPNEKLFRQKIEISQVSLTPTVNSKSKKGGDSKTNIEETGGSAKKVDRRRSVRSTSALVKIKNYVFLLYPLPPHDDGSFFSTNHLRTYASFSDLQETAKVFYETHGDTLENKLIPPDYKSFVDEMLMKYKFYQLQLEFAWLDCSIEFCESLTNFRLFLGNYYRDTLRKYFESRLEELKGKCSEVMKVLGASMKAVEDNYASIHNKLKPMFGHPERRRTLALVETYMDQAEDFNQKMLIDNLDPSKESIKHYCIKTETIFLDMEKILSCIRGSTTLLSHSRELEGKIVERIEVLQKILSPDYSNTDVTTQTDFEIDLKNKLQEYRKRASIPAECLISYSRTTHSLTTIASTTNIDIEESIRNNYDEYEKIAEKIEKLRTKCSDIHDQYKTMWAQDIERIMNLYKVKYDQTINE